MFRWLKDRRGFAMPYHVALIALVALPMLILSGEIVRAMYVNVHIQTAVDAACSAAVQAVDVLNFIETGNLVIDSAQAAGYAQREFDSTVARANIENYTPSLDGLSIINNTIVECRASARMNWSLPGIAPLTFNVMSASEAMARR